MRLILIVLALIALPATASADVKARYTGAGGPASIEVDDNGDSRLGGDNGESYSLFTASGDYVVFTRDRALVAARYEDFHFVLDAMAAPIRGAAGGEPEQPRERSAAPTLTEAGKQNIAGYEGIRYEWVERPSGRKSFAIVSSAPELRPLGHAMAKLLAQMPSFAETMTGERQPALVALVEMLGSTALLQLDDQATLAQVSFEPLPDERFRLPATLLTRDQVAAMLQPGEPGVQ